MERGSKEEVYVLLSERDVTPNVRPRGMATSLFLMYVKARLFLVYHTRNVIVRFVSAHTLFIEIKIVG